MAKTPGDGARVAPKSLEKSDGPHGVRLKTPESLTDGIRGDIKKAEGSEHAGTVWKTHLVIMFVGRPISSIKVSRNMLVREAPTTQRRLVGAPLCRPALMAGA